MSRSCVYRPLAAQLGRAPSTISREVRRNEGNSKYRAGNADERAWRLASRPKQCRLAVNLTLQVEVAQKLSDDWSPQQIAGWLKIAYADDPKMRVSHETIYKSLFVQARGVLKKELLSHLRTRRSNSRPRKTLGFVTPAAKLARSVAATG